MAYEKQTWENLPSTNTPITADRLNHMEDGIEEAWEHGGGGGVNIGTIVPFSGSTIPENFMICDGSAISRTTYSDLFDIIGTTYGSGDGSTTFNIPDLKGRTLVGLDSNDTDFDTLGETGGSKELQQHSHKTTTDLYAKALSVSTSGAEAFSASGTSNYRRNANLSNNDTGTAGTGNSGNLQPYITINYIIKVAESSTVSEEASIVNTYSQSSINGYSCNYINQLNTKNISQNSTYKTSDLVISGSEQKIIETSLTTTGKNVLVSFSVPIKGAGSGSPQLKIKVDGTLAKTIVESFSTGHLSSYTIVLENITTGTHTFELWGNRNNDSSLTVISFTEINILAMEI